MCIVVALSGICAYIYILVANCLCQVCESSCIGDTVTLSIEEVVIGENCRPVFSTLVKTAPDIIILLDYPVEAGLELLLFGHTRGGDLGSYLLGKKFCQLLVGHTGAVGIEVFGAFCFRIDMALPVGVIGVALGAIRNCLINLHDSVFVKIEIIFTYFLKAQKALAISVVAFLAVL